MGESIEPRTSHHGHIRPMRSLSTGPESTPAFARWQPWERGKRTRSGTSRRCEKHLDYCRGRRGGREFLPVTLGCRFRCSKTIHESSLWCLRHVELSFATTLVPHPPRGVGLLLPALRGRAVGRQGAAACRRRHSVAGRREGGGQSPTPVLLAIEGWQPTRSLAGCLRQQTGCRARRSPETTTARPSWFRGGPARRFEGKLGRAV